MFEGGIAGLGGGGGEIGRVLFEDDIARGGRLGGGEIERVLFEGGIADLGGNAGTGELDEDTDREPN